MLHVLRLEQKRERGELSDAEYYGALPPRIITGQNATGILVVPQPMPAEAWEAVDTAAARAAELEAWANKMGVSFKPEPPPAKEATHAAATSKSFRNAPDKNPRPKFKSLAKRLLHR